MQVRNLHFEQGKSAAEIAKLLNVNRNTVNADIRRCHQHIGNKMNTLDITTMMSAQIQRMEIQRDRLFENLEESQSMAEKIKLEKLIYCITAGLFTFCSKMIDAKNKHLANTITIAHVSEDEIKDFVRHLIFDGICKNSNFVYSGDELESNFIQTKKCDLPTAQHVFAKMKVNGLSNCESLELSNAAGMTSGLADYSQKYYLAKFALMRGYVTGDEIYQIIKNRD